MRDVNTSFPLWFLVPWKSSTTHIHPSLLDVDLVVCGWVQDKMMSVCWMSMNNAAWMMVSSQGWGQRIDADFLEAEPYPEMVTHVLADDVR